jgi:hypothetical protein
MTMVMVMVMVVLMLPPDKVMMYGIVLRATR